MKWWSEIWIWPGVIFIGLVFYSLLALLIVFEVIPVCLRSLVGWKIPHLTDWEWSGFIFCFVTEDLPNQLITG